MSATYAVPCVCGKNHSVTAGAAGSTITCSCGQSVSVPSLAKLKASVGESSTSADFIIEQLINTNQLPLERECVVCNVPTQSTATVSVECERQVMSESSNLRWYEILLIPVSWLLVLMSYFNRQKHARPIGVDRVFHLPVRVCEHCQNQRPNPRTLLTKTPLYQELLAKYPMSLIR